MLRWSLLPIDIDKTTYHEVGDRIWRVDSGTDYGEVWDMDFFEQHALDYLDEEGSISRNQQGSQEMLEADFDGRGYRLIKDRSSDEFSLMFYKDAEGEVEEPANYIDRIWQNEIENLLSRTARTKMVEKHELSNSEDTYRQRLSETI